MSRLPKFILVLTTLALVLSTLVVLSPAASAVHTGAVIIGSNDSASRYPIGLEAGVDSSSFPNFQAGGVYQQVYSGGAFSGPVTITQIAFASSALNGSRPGTATYNFNIALGKTPAVPNGLSTSLAANRGDALVPVFSGPVVATLTADNQFDVVIDVAPFAYDPAEGNLLLEMTMNSPVQFTGGPVLYFTAGTVSNTSRAANPTGVPSGAFTDTFGLRTRFTTNTVGPAQVTLGNLVQTFDGSAKSVSVSTDPAGLNVAVTYDGSSIAPTNAGSYAVTAIVSEANFNGQANGTLIIQAANQQIAFDALPNKAVGDADFNVSATASSNLLVSFAANGNCTLIGTLVHLTGVGPCTITASQDGNANINHAAQVARTFSIDKAEQQITFEALADKRVGDADFTVSATASSNLAVGFAAGGNCTVSGTQVHLAGAGSCTITASQGGDANTNAAASVGRTFAIGKADQQITFEPLADKTFGDADFGVSSTASSNLAVSLAAAGNCTVTGSQVHLMSAGPCTITASQDGDTNTNAATPVARAFLIGKVGQQIIFDGLADKKFGDADFSVSATTSSNLAVSFAANGNCSVLGTQVHIAAAGQCTITSSQDGDVNTSAALTVARTFLIGKADQQITFAALADRKFGDADFDINAAASSNLAVVLSASGNCTLNGNQLHITGAGPCTVTASQDGDANINAAAPSARTFSISKADQQITFHALADRKLGDADFSITATASSILTVALSASGNCTLNGTQVHMTGAGQCTITASQDGDVNTNAAAAIARTFSISKTDQQITFAALVDKKFGDADFNVGATASSNLDVRFAATGNCTVLGTQVHITAAGACTVTASQDGDANTSAVVPVSRTFSISKADQQITFAALPDRKVGDADFNLRATASSHLAVAFSAGGNCAVTETQVHIIGAGACTITASQDGNSDYSQAAAVVRTFAIADQTNSQTLISFSSSAYETAESVGALRITVSRIGDTSGTSTVEYATDDSAAAVDCEKLNGIAGSRCDFNAAIGTLTFAPGEVEKTFDVLINRDSRVEPVESFTVLLSRPTGGAILSMPSSATVQIIDRSGGIPLNTNVIDDTRTFVRQQYHDFLNRESDAAGLAFWIDNIDKCDDPARRPANLTVAQCKEVMRVNTSAAFFLSIEFSESGGLVHAFYAAALDRQDRTPGYAEFIRDTQAVGRGVIVGEAGWQQLLNANRDAFMKDFVTRPEFVGLYPTVDSPEVYVNKLYLHAFGREATATEVAAGVNEFGGASAAADPGARARSLLHLTKADDFRDEVNRCFVLMQYVGYLRRSPNDLPDSNFDGYEFWLRKLNSFNGNFVEAEMVKAFLDSGEYRGRFGP